MIAVKEPTEIIDLYSTVSQLPAHTFIELSHQVWLLQKKRNIQFVLADDDHELIDTIYNTKLNSEDEVRIDLLTDKLEEQALTEDELQELLKLSEKAEKIDVIRVEAMAELATKRDISLSQLLIDLGLEPQYG
ncbi:MAG: hypothetical protein AAF639_12625 [Chloroflexota bacterium]